MSDRFVFTVAYEEAIMKSAARQFVMRAVFLEHIWTSVIAFFAIVASAALTVYARDFSFVTGLFAGLVLAALALTFLVGWAHWRAMRAKMSRMKTPRATFRLRDDEIAVDADSGSSTLRWDSFKDVWRFQQVWLLMLAANQFITLPLGGVPPEALAFIESKVRRRKL